MSSIVARPTGDVNAVDNKDAEAKNQYYSRLAAVTHHVGVYLSTPPEQDEHVLRSLLPGLRSVCDAPFFHPSTFAENLSPLVRRLAKRFERHMPQMAEFLIPSSSEPSAEAVIQDRLCDSRGVASTGWQLLCILRRLLSFDLNEAMSDAAGAHLPSVLVRCVLLIQYQMKDIVPPAALLPVLPAASPSASSATEALATSSASTSGAESAEVHQETDDNKSIDGENQSSQPEQQQPSAEESRMMLMIIRTMTPMSPIP